MTGIPIREAQIATLGDQDYVPIERLGSQTAYRARALSLGINALNIKDYGAVGDGVTDDSAAIQAALDVDKSSTQGRQYVPGSRGITLFFPVGVYKINTSLDITDRADVHLLGESQYNTILDFYCTGKVGMDFCGSGYCSVQNMTLRGDTTSTPSAAFFCARTTYTNGLATFHNVIEDVYIVGKYTVGGLVLLNMEQPHINRVRSYDGTGGGWGVAPLVMLGDNEFSLTSDYATIYTSYDSLSLGWVSNCEFAVSTAGLECIYLGNNVSNMTIVNTFCYNQASNADCLIKVAGEHYSLYFRDLYFEVAIADVFKHVTYAGSNNTVDSMLLENCFCSNFTHAFWYGLATTKVYHSRLVNNRMGKSGTILIFADLDDSVIDGTWLYTNNDITCDKAHHNELHLANSGTLTVVTEEYDNHVFLSGTSLKLRGEGSGTHFALGQPGETNIADIRRIKCASASWTPGTIGEGAIGATTLSVTCALGDVITASLSVYTDGIMVHAHVLSSNQVRVIAHNMSGSGWTPGALTVKVIVIAADVITL